MLGRGDTPAAKVWKHFLCFCTFAVGVFVPAESSSLVMLRGKAESPAPAPWPGHGQQGLWGAFQQLLRAVPSNTLFLSFTRTSHRWNCAVPCPQQACDRANHSSSMDRSSAPIVMEIALETVAPANIFRSTVSCATGRLPGVEENPPPASQHCPFLQWHGGALLALMVGMGLGCCFAW